MKRCPITLEAFEGTLPYSRKGLHQLAPHLESLAPLALSAKQQREEASARAGKMSVQGVQLKLAAQLKIREGCFQLVDQNGRYILKPQSLHYRELPENEALTMSLAKIAGLDVPVHGLVYSLDDSFTYFIKRFDRGTGHQKFAQEDFAQLLNYSRETKYNSSMEQVAKVVLHFCSFPKVEALKLLKLTLFNFLIGNEDMHLKNFSLITRGPKVTLAPAYDLLNTAIVMDKTEEDLALPLNGKKRHLKRKDLLDYFGEKCLGLNPTVIAAILFDLEQMLPRFKAMIRHSFLSEEMQEKYLSVLAERQARLHL